MDEGGAAGTKKKWEIYDIHSKMERERKCQQFFMKNNCSNAVLALAVIKLAAAAVATLFPGVAAPR